MLRKYISQTVRSNQKSVHSTLEVFFRCFPVELAIFLRTPEFLKPQQNNLFPIGWTFLFSIIHVINLHFNNAICMYFSVSIYTIAFIANPKEEKKIIRQAFTWNFLKGKLQSNCDVFLALKRYPILWERGLLKEKQYVFVSFRLFA